MTKIKGVQRQTVYGRTVSLGLSGGQMRILAGSVWTGDLGKEQELNVDQKAICVRH